MSARLRRPVVATLSSLGLTLVLAATAVAQGPPPDQPGEEVLARGPVHEAYASTTEHQPNGGSIVPKAPPAAIEELPPDQKPAGENVTWIPGYWQWDEERGDYIWVSGFWRVPPPGRAWVPGSWREARGGWQWAHGFWQEVRAEQPAEIEYLPPPPAPLEFAPSVPSPGETYTYVPGTWVWRANRYAWRPGVWVDYRPGWIWTPAHYRWTPAGYVFVEGYWDYPLAQRGILFAPVYLPPAVYAGPAYVYTPTIVVREPVLYTSLFVRRGYGAYYFGDYYEPRYVSAGYTAWCGSYGGGGFSVSVGFGRGVVYDPLWSYYRVHYRADPVWMGGIREVYVGRYNGTIARPPRTLVQQTIVVNNITNTTVVNRTVVNNVTMLSPLHAVAHTDKVALTPVAPAERVREQQVAAQIRTVAVTRTQTEARLATAGPAAPGQAFRPQVARLDVPNAVVARAQAPAATAGAAHPPPPVTAKAAPLSAPHGATPQGTPHAVGTQPAAATPQHPGQPTHPGPNSTAPRNGPSSRTPPRNPPPHQGEKKDHPRSE